MVGGRGREVEGGERAEPLPSLSPLRRRSNVSVKTRFVQLSCLSACVRVVAPHFTTLSWLTFIRRRRCVGACHLFRGRISLGGGLSNAVVSQTMTKWIITASLAA